MANNDVIQAKQVIDDLTASFDKHNESIESSAKSLTTYSNNIVELPSKVKQMIEALTGSLNLVKQETQAIEANVIAVKANEEGIKKLVQSRQQNATKTSEEIVNNRILAQNADNLTKQTSALAGAYGNLDAKAKEASKTLRDIIASGKLASETQLEYNSRLAKAQTEFDGYNKKLLEADKAVGAWSRSNIRSVEGLSNLTTGLKSAMNAFGIFTGMYLAAQVTMGAIDINKNLSDDLAQLQIYLKGTKKDADDVFESLKKLDTRTSLADLLGLAQIVAKKGVVKEEISGIVKELDSLFLVLGEEAGDKKEATASIVKLISIFNTDGKITDERVKEIGSSLQYLTTHGVATGKYLIDFSERLGAFRSLTGQTLPQILGLGAGFEQMGQKVEVAGNATGQIITKLMSNAEKYAKMANIPLEKFKNLLETNSSEALIEFAEGMKKNSNSLESFAAGFEDVGLKGARVKGVLAELSINGDLFRQKMDASAKAIADTGANAEAAGLKQATFAGTIDKVKKEFENLVSTQGVQDFFSNTSIVILRLTQAITAIPFGLVIGGLTAWTAWQAKVKGEIVATAITQAWNNEQTSLGIVRNAAAKLGLLGKAEAERVATLSTEASTIALKEKLVTTQAEIIVEREALVALEAGTIGTELSTTAKEAEIIATKAHIASLEADIVAMNAVVLENEAMTASLAATPWGTIAVAIGLATWAIYEYATAETYAAKVAKKLEDDKKQTSKQLEEYNKLELSDLEAKNKKIEQENRSAVIAGKKTQEQATKDIKEAQEQILKFKILSIQELMDLDEKDFNRFKKQQNDKIKSIKINGQEEIDKIAEINESIKLKEQNYLQWRENYQKTIKSLATKYVDTGMDNDEAGIALTEKQKKEAEKAEKERLKRIEENYKLEAERKLKDLDLDKQRIRENIDDKKYGINEIIALEIKYTADERLQAEIRHAEKIREAKKLHQEELAEAKEAHESSINADKNYKNRLKIAEDEFLMADEKALSDSHKRILKEQEEYDKAKEEYIKGHGKPADEERYGLGVNTFTEKDIDEMSKDYEKAKEKYAEKIAGIDKKIIAGLSKSEKVELSKLENNLEFAILNGKKEDIKKAEIELNEFLNKQKAIESYLKSFVTKFEQSSGFSSLFKILNNEIKGFGKNWKVTFDAMAEVAKEAYSFINKNSEKNYDAEYARLEKQHSISIAFAGNSAAAKTEIDRQYEEERKKIAQKQAESKKQEAIFNIILSTAEAIVGALPNIPLSIAIGAIGALELGLAQNAPLPQYWTGTDNAKGGMAIVDEFQPEVHTDKKGNIKSFGSEKGANLRMTEQGDKIYRSREEYFNKELKSILAQNKINPFDVELQKEAVLMVNNNAGMSKSDFDSGISKLASIISNKQEFEMNISKKGLEVYVKEGHTKKQQLNDLFTSKGKIV